MTLSDRFQPVGTIVAAAGGPARASGSGAGCAARGDDPQRAGDAERPDERCPWRKALYSTRASRWRAGLATYGGQGGEVRLHSGRRRPELGMGWCTQAMRPGDRAGQRVRGRGKTLGVEYTKNRFSGQKRDLLAGEFYRSMRFQRPTLEI